jgi:hypothetical protein
MTIYTTIKMVREYEVTYVTKEHLMRNGWDIVAYNPPGSQGTFTIPNPNKDPNYRGQTGSESPDIVALKIKDDINYILIVEAKPTHNERDVLKMKKLFLSKARRDLFLKIVSKQCIANNIDFDIIKNSKIIFAKAHGGNENLVEDMITFHIVQKNSDWNPENFNARENIVEYFDVNEFNSFGI